MKNRSFTLSLIVFCPLFVLGQAGGIYKVDQSVVASGGGASSGGIYSLEGSAGQSPAGGTLQGGLHSVYSGFFTPILTLNAATLSIGGRVLTSDGRGIKNVQITLTGPDGETRSLLTGALGRYQFNDVKVGETYILTVSSKRFAFRNPTQSRTVNDDLDNIDFVATEQ